LPAGYSVKELHDGGYTVNELKAVGFTYQQLITAFPKHMLEAAGMYA